MYKKKIENSFISIQTLARKISLHKHEYAKYHFPRFSCVLQQARRIFANPAGTADASKPQK